MADEIPADIQRMIDNPGMYITGDTQSPEANVPIWSESGKLWSMKLDEVLAGVAVGRAKPIHRCGYRKLRFDCESSFDTAAPTARSDRVAPELLRQLERARPTDANNADRCGVPAAGDCDDRVIDGRGRHGTALC